MTASALPLFQRRPLLRIFAPEAIGSWILINVRPVTSSSPLACRRPPPAASLSSQSAAPNFLLPDSTIDVHLADLLEQVEKGPHHSFQASSRLSRLPIHSILSSPPIRRLNPNLSVTTTYAFWALLTACSPATSPVH